MPPPVIPTLSNPIFQQDTLFYKGDNGYIKGWNWGSEGRNLDEALGIDYYHKIWLEVDGIAHSDYIYNPKVIQTFGLDSIWPGIEFFGGDNVPFNAIALHLEPTIIVDSTNNFKPRYRDNTGAVFGWTNRTFTNGVADTFSSGSDFSRIRFNRNASVQFPIKVLDNIWNGTILRWEDLDGDDHGVWIGRSNSINYNSQEDRAVYHPFNGKQFYVSINLKAPDMSDVENHLNDTILLIKLPYILTHDDTVGGGHNYSYTNGLVKFDKMPYKEYAPSNIDTIRSTINNHFRGIARKDSSLQNKTTDFVILGKC